MAKFCPQCAHPIVERNMPFCPKCGARLPNISSEPQAPVSQPATGQQPQQPSWNSPPVNSASTPIQTSAQQSQNRKIENIPKKKRPPSEWIAICCGGAILLVIIMAALSLAFQVLYPQTDYYSYHSLNSYNNSYNSYPITRFSSNFSSQSSSSPSSIRNFLPATFFLVVSMVVIVVFFASSRKKYQSSPRSLQKPASEVYFSVISPKTVVPESSFLLDIWAHLDEQRNDVINRSKEGSINDDILIKTKGPTKILKGTDLVIHLEFPDLIIENSEQHLFWTGNISSANFLIKVPKDILNGVKIGTVKIYAEGLLILKFFFEINIAEKMTSKEPIHVNLHRISKAFVSYASPDREKVLSRIQGIQKIAPHLEFKMDIKDIKSGEKWKESIRKFIETSDIFYLFWSKNAKDSLWVEKEWKCALKLKGIDFIDPIPLDSPENVPPPVELTEKHFNDWTLAYSRAKK